MQLGSLSVELGLSDVVAIGELPRVRQPFTEHRRYEGGHKGSSYQVTAWCWPERVHASHAARCVARHGVRSQPVPVALMGECSIPVV